ncbi:porin family protein [Myroides sp. NP-2]|uniref:porin family protein n=1 Tax=Myroides sp. NP-2 TaxID=2759945 RepID=UPI0015F976B5|nr:porin family protein [Myroides sp. NP-2]MBB1149675.1 porin family protein [Myroides sp. NP-2]
MKATIFSLCACTLALCSLDASAQKAQHPFRLGVKVSSNHANIAGNLKNLSTSSAQGFSAGITTQYHFDRLFIQTDLLYSESKSPVEHAFVHRAKWKSIDIPIALGYTLLDVQKVKVHVLAGGIYSQIIDDQLKLTENLERFDYSLNKNNVKAQIGAGVTVGDFVVELKYSRSLNNLSKDIKSKSNHLQIGLSYMFL